MGRGTGRWAIRGLPVSPRCGDTRHLGLAPISGTSETQTSVTGMEVSCLRRWHLCHEAKTDLPRQSQRDRACPQGEPPNCAPQPSQ